MYFPVIHARQSEKNALIEIKSKLATAGNVLPLVIPVKDNKKNSGSGLRGVAQCITHLSKAKIQYYILTTPYTSKMPYGQADVLKLIKEKDKNERAVPVVAITKSKPISTLQSEIESLGDAAFAVLHHSESDDLEKLTKLLDIYKDKINWHFFYSSGCDAAYYNLWNYRKVIITDNFVKEQNNAAFANNPDLEFSDLGFRYKKLGFQGYGDHVICGESYKPGGGRAYAIAIHLTYPSLITSQAKDYTSVWINHFVSDNQTLSVPEIDRFFEALTKLIGFYKSNKKALAFSTACVELQDYFDRHWYPKLGTIKRCTIQHHIELMSHLNL